MKSHKVKLILRGFGEKEVSITGWPLSIQENWIMKGGALVTVHFGLTCESKNKEDWNYFFTGFGIS